MAVMAPVDIPIEMARRFGVLLPTSTTLASARYSVGVSCTSSASRLRELSSARKNAVIAAARSSVLLTAPASVVVVGCVTQAILP